MLHDVQRILGIGIEGCLPAEPSEGEWQVGITNLFEEPMSELRRKGIFTCGGINVAEVMQLCHPVLGYGDPVNSLLHGYCRLYTAGG